MPRHPQIYIVRHGETEWSKSGQHTGDTDLELTPNGKHQARTLSYYVFENPSQGYVEHQHIGQIYVSPLKRAQETLDCLHFEKKHELTPIVDKDLMEWHYGDYEGKTTAEIHQTQPGWNIFDDGCPNATERADRVIQAVRAFHNHCAKTSEDATKAAREDPNSDVLIVAHSHFLRVFVARWLDLDPIQGKYIILDTAGISILGYEHNLDEPVIRAMNVTSKLFNILA
ncbi:hypothetical protein BZG36_04487 [Bifiguratus adelaidae]|uniref:Uncharacterized protein n=1 Tax=Bifiguratus adelaidae TaxID=1938954 RepID=A0A261XYD9_9FUNG|nr:hypothetical protein BZG36_04487 [Bifiguratus adelaidae]